MKRSATKCGELIRSLDYVMTIHGEEEMENDGLSVFEIENAVLTGEIVERQQDSDTKESKYLVAGKALDEQQIVIVVKISLTGKLVIITVYREKDEYEN